MNRLTTLGNASEKGCQVLCMGRRTDHNGMGMGRIDLNVLEIGNEVFGNEESVSTFLNLGHDHSPHSMWQSIHPTIEAPCATGNGAVFGKATA
jgi:hypothetical protein